MLDKDKYKFEKKEPLEPLQPGANPKNYVRDYDINSLQDASVDVIDFANKIEQILTPGSDMKGVPYLPPNFPPDLVVPDGLEFDKETRELRYKFEKDQRSLTIINYLLRLYSEQTSTMKIAIDNFLNEDTYHHDEFNSDLNNHNLYKLGY